MPDKKTLERAARDKRQGKAASTQAGEFVREEIDHIREGKHGVRSTEQAIAIGLSKARRAGVDLAPPEKGKTSGRTRQHAKRDLAAGKKKRTATGAVSTSRKAAKPKSARRSRAVTKALKKESRKPASKKALAKHGRKVARKRGAADRSAAARKAAQTRKRRAK